MIPDGIQGWDHYAYGGNSPIRYTDPTGHFKEEELEKWFGKKWMDRFSLTMRAFLKAGQLGDVLNGNGLSFMFVLDQDGILSAWDLQSRTLEDISSYNNVDPKTAALYRPKWAGPEPTDTDWNLLPNPSLGEGIGNPAYSNPPYEQVYNLGCNTCSESYDLSHGWYQGENNGLYVDVYSGPVGIDFRAWDWISTGATGYGIGTGIQQVVKNGAPKGGVWGASAGLAISLVDALQWDTFYNVQSGNVAPSPLNGVPTPP